MSKLNTFTEAKNPFDSAHATAKVVKCIVPVNGKQRDTTSILDVRGSPSEEYYKWHFIYAIINSGLYARDFVGVEIQFPKGNSAIIKLDGAFSIAEIGWNTTTPTGKTDTQPISRSSTTTYSRLSSSRRTTRTSKRYSRAR
jgi:hypothetical protein